MLFGRSLQPAVWQQGTLMTPQHLQHQDAHHHAHVAARLQGAAPRSIGLLQLSVDGLALQEGKVSLPQGAVIMPKGECLAWHNQDGCAPESRALPPTTVAPEQRLDVYLVLPALRQDRANVAHAPRLGSTCRFTAEPTRLAELSDGTTPPTSIMLARANLRLAFAHELQEGDCRVHVLSLIRLPHGGAQIDATFLPQSLRLRAQGELVARLEALLGTVRTAESRLRPTGGPAASVSIDAAVRHRGLLQLHGALNDLLGDPLTAPIDVYRQLRACLAWLCPPLPQGTELNAELCRFDDAHPGDALWPLLAALEQAVATGPLPIHLYPARQMAKSGLFIANLAPWPKQANATWYVRVTLQRADGAATDAGSMRLMGEAWVRLAKVAAPSQMPRLIRSALRGIALRPADATTAGADVTSGAQTLLFELDTTDATWPLVQAEGDVVLLPPPAVAALPHHTLEVALICRAAHGAQP